MEIMNKKSEQDKTGTWLVSKSTGHISTKVVYIKVSKATFYKRYRFYE